MNQYNKSIVPILESVYTDLSPIEKRIADFFIKNKKKQDFKAKTISTKLYVSEAALSRFSKKCGFSGYRQFIFAYENNIVEDNENIASITKEVFTTYQELLNKSYSLIKDEQMNRIAYMMVQAKYVYIYGIGSSGMCARDFKIRFMRLGLRVEYVTDEHIMKMNSVIINEQSLLICISVSGANLQQYLKMAKEKGAKTVLITCNYKYRMKEYCDEVLKAAVTKNLDVGDVISPQFVILVIIDVLHSHFLNLDYSVKYALLKDTLSFVHEDIENR
ncbi:MurR/RpiR family transcriptional regulator [Clostridioides sp. ZZV15-6383]|uniref:MurR/RpiR family transcriptional regulator n=1 Tax=Clostridioides sp. ZZV15-6383 TaxID=2811498 RepID=UPI001D0F9AF4|nr:MurR/RpiR family transcriptional regulator [Clostridioides sp. ZZV15-6383]